VVANVLNNAAKFTPSHGRVEVTLQAQGDAALVQVADNGIGIPPEALPGIFDMFVQLHPGRSVASGGLGLGLTLARHIAESHGGSLAAHSEGPGTGSRFTIRLPLVESAPCESGSSAQAGGSGRRTRVLVIDDNEDAATTLAEMLRLFGHDVRVAFDGAHGLATAREFCPEVAFLDLNMPEMSGIQVAEAIRQDARTRKIRLIALTGMGQAADVAATRASGFIAHLTKPASPEDVLRFAAGEHANVVSIARDAATKR
jgi:CheY-like chemotaxis protein